MIMQYLILIIEYCNLLICAVYGQCVLVLFIFGCLMFMEGGKCGIHLWKTRHRAQLYMVDQNTMRTRA